MGFANGRLPDSALAPIPGGRLRKDAAAAWIAMCDEARRRALPVPEPDGADSTYRPYDRQVFWRRWWCGQGQCQNAAVPGTSRHGLGIAVDCAEDATHHAATIDMIGEKYGWSKKWSDAPWEPWHNTYKVGVWQQIVYAFLPLHVGEKGVRRASSGVAVYGLTRRLQACGYIKQRTSKYTYDVERAVRRFQQHHHLAVDGIVGRFTYEAVKQAAAVCQRSGRKEV